MSTPFHRERAKNKAELATYEELAREVKALKQEQHFDQRISKAREKLVKIATTHVKNAELLMDKDEAWLQALLQSDTASTLAMQRKDEMEGVVHKLSMYEQGISQAKKSFSAHQARLSKHNAEVRRLHDLAINACTRESLGDTSALPSTTKACQQQIDRLGVSIELMGAGASDDQSLTARHASLTEQVASLEQQKEQDDDELQSMSTAMLALRDQWLLHVQELVATVDKQFARYMQRILCTGKVTLQKHGDDFDKYALMLEVSFRAGQALKVLEPGSQSGGEKSVSTMLYLLSLQHVSNAPFRIVDEINQGMDATNERAVFNQIVHASTLRQSVPADLQVALKPSAKRRKAEASLRGESVEEVAEDDQENGSENEASQEGGQGPAQSGLDTYAAHQSAVPQYFVVTPKLLPNLDMPKESGITVISVYGGKFIDDDQLLEIGGASKGRRGVQSFVPSQSERRASQLRAMRHIDLSQSFEYSNESLPGRMSRGALDKSVAATRWDSVDSMVINASKFTPDEATRERARALARGM